MPIGYQPPKFQQFDREGNPKQHIAHFVETCENARSRGDQTSQAIRLKLKRKYFRVVCRQHEGVDKHQTAEGKASHRLHKPMESSKSGLQRQAHITVCSGDVHLSQDDFKCSAINAVL
ncbi:ty3-gypsy retrotransposon protein [Cucumis melo var. makuwa]|uniref:Ty3-gypsy retrotransposon protein n=1 Tax=Cucumis melo var. makuwa TaxID=1194695 RepID=A0A5D3DU94_CUCMM|nr:ty3-gypsy retrotransposon protein [Cucumis melo var. makuwa]TYK27074.1 ty3-gypsy retrotransposon protein [Cucumis melo var. makuwa]